MKSRFVNIVFVVWILVAFSAILSRWLDLAPPPGAAAQPPGPEWFESQIVLFGNHPWITQTHLFSSLLFILIVPFQFSTRFRSKNLKTHRILGRVFILCTPIVALTGLLLGVLIPFGGALETLFSALLFVLIIYSAYKGISFARKGRIDEHRAWMIRLFSWSMSIATMRIILGAFFYIQPWSDRDWFGISLNLGLLVNLVAAEFWITKTRKRV